MNSEVWELYETINSSLKDDIIKCDTDTKIKEKC